MVLCAKKEPANPRLRVGALLLLTGTVSIVLGSLYGYYKSTAADHQPISVDFDASMAVTKHPQKIAGTWGSTVIGQLRTLYQKNQPALLAPHSEPLIPRIIHQIWLGSPLPEKYAQWQRTWIEHHPGWEYYLWTDADIEALRTQGLFVGNTYEQFMHATNYAERSDILRILLLWHFGGLYVDTDFECLRSCEPYHYYYDFYIGIQPLDVAYLQLGSGLIGAAPKHPFLSLIIRAWEKTKHKHGIIERTGPIMITRAFITYLQAAPDARRIIAFPATYFYPRGYCDTEDTRSTWLCPESSAVHHWEGSWLTDTATIRKGTS